MPPVKVWMISSIAIISSDKTKRIYCPDVQFFAFFANQFPIFQRAAACARSFNTNIGGGAPASSVANNGTHDGLLYHAPNLTLQASTLTIDAYEDTIAFNILVDNLSINANANNAWIAVNTGPGTTITSIFAAIEIYILREEERL